MMTRYLSQLIRKLPHMAISLVYGIDDAAIAENKRIVSHLCSALKDRKVVDREAWKIANPAND